jgi:trehalose 6-phosphate phosphatase
VALPTVLQPLRDRLFEAALFLDYDGTLAPIVTDPARAVPVPGVPDLLRRLGRRAGLVAVVSGRPVAYLAEQLGRPPGVRLAGLYGMEEAVGDGPTLVPTGLEHWRPVVHAAAVRLSGTVPPGVEVEEKGLAVTVHWRRAPAAEEAALAATVSAQAEGGLVAHPGRMSVELRPPVGIDKGTVVLRLGASHPVLACFGDDLGDLPAFAAADRLAATTGAVVVKVAVADAETAPAVLEAADLCLDGPVAAVAVLGALLSP